MDNEKIYNKLKNQYNFLTQYFDERQVIGIFVYGLSNYGIAETEQEIKTVACICPLFEDFCCQNTSLKSYYLKDNNNDNIRITDIRLLYEKALNQESVILEAAFTEYNIINPRYKKAFNKYVYMNRETIFHANQQLRIHQAIQIGKKALQHYKETHSQDVSDLLKASYIRIACRQYMNGVSCENCINLKQDYYRNYLLQIKHGEIVPDIEDIEDDLNSLLEESSGLFINNDSSELVKTAIVEIVKISLTDMVQSTEFENLLTQTENQALKLILSHLEDGVEGNISISQLTNESSISRPVFKNVIQKMKDNVIAEIENQGVKGTYIKIIDGHLLSK